MVIPFTTDPRVVEAHDAWHVKFRPAFDLGFKSRIVAPQLENPFPKNTTYWWAWRDGQEIAAQILADNPEVDILQVAHTHQTVSQTTDAGVLVGGVRSGGREIARFDLTLDAEGEIVDKSVQIVDMSGVAPARPCGICPW